MLFEFVFKEKITPTQTSLFCVEVNLLQRTIKPLARSVLEQTTPGDPV